MNDYNKSDVEFLREMIIHHEAAIKMSASEYSEGENAEVKKWALAIFSGQKDEVVKFRSWLKERGIKSAKPSGMGGM